MLNFLLHIFLDLKNKNIKIAEDFMEIFDATIT